MKKLLLTCAIAAISIGLCSTVIASPTLTQTDSPKSASPDTYMVKDDSADSNFFLVDWWYWLLDNVFGRDRHNSGSRYYSGNSNSGSGNGSGEGGSGNDSGDGGWSIDSDDGGLGFDSGGDLDLNSGDDGWSIDSGDGGLGFDSGGDLDLNSGDDGWSIDTGDGSLDFNFGDGGWNIDSGNGGWSINSGNGDWGYNGTDTGPVQSVPAPGALILVGIGSGIVSWLRRHRTL